MSAEELLIPLLIDQGAAGLRQLYASGISADDFQTYDQEFEWIERRAYERKPINERIFRERFPDFDWLLPKEPLKDLAATLKEERAFIDVRSLLETIDSSLTQDNAIDMVEQAREILTQISRRYSPRNDIPLFSNVDKHLERMRQGMILAKQGVPPGIPTGIPHLDFHWDGFVNGRYIVVLGRPGNAKSFLIEEFDWTAAKNGYRVGLFSPEMNEHEHLCRLHTLASADKQVQEALGLKHSFRNRPLLRMSGFIYKEYRKFCQYLDREVPGEVVLFTNTHRRQLMTPQYIEARIDDYGLDMVIVDPLYELHLPGRRDQWDSTPRVAAISTEVSSMAESYNIPIIVSNQALRMQTRQDDAPHMDRSFNTDVPVQQADHVIGLKFFSEQHRMLCRCSKSRFGQNAFRFELDFRPNTGMIKPITPVPFLRDNEDDDELEEMVTGEHNGA